MKIKSELDDIEKRVEELALRFREATITDLTRALQVLRSPWRLALTHFWIGLFQGCGTAIGISVFGGIAIYFMVNFLGNAVKVPLLGKYIASVVQVVQTELGDKKAR